MYTDPKVNDLVEHTHTYHVAKVIEVNTQFGWFKVQYLDGVEKMHQCLEKGSSVFTKLTNEQRADYLLKLEKAGITDFWREE